jgi:hypothetical protein
MGMGLDGELLMFLSFDIYLFFLHPRFSGDWMDGIPACSTTFLQLV